MGLRKVGSLQKNGVRGLHGHPAVKTQLPLCYIIFLGDLGIVLSVPPCQLSQPRLLPVHFSSVCPAGSWRKPEEAAVAPAFPGAR